MARPRVPKDKARATGQDVKHKERFSSRSEPKSKNPLGDAPEWMTQTQVQAWEQFRKSLFWLDDTHRFLVGIACTIQARVIAGEDVGVQALNLLRQCLGQMGATPADASKIKIADEEGESDPSDKYLE